MLKSAIFLLLVLALLTRLDVSVFETNGKEYHKSASDYLTGVSALSDRDHLTNEFGTSLHNRTSNLVVDFINPMPFLPGNSVSAEFDQHKLQSPIHNFEYTDTYQKTTTEFNFHDFT